ncbi:MAG: cohesin domain-containing protein, partial [Candidatus Parcubacteria bacterium]|nr:cohesin domain-containing protein [Candidatus Parcubacteria bacterium]
MEKINKKSTYRKSAITLLLFISCFLFLAQAADASTLYLMPQSQTVYQGDTFIADVRLDTEGKEINALDISLDFSTDRLEVIDFSKGNSILNFWVYEPSVIDGKINFIGGTPGGFKGDGLIARITFLNKEIGKTNIVFREDSKILLNNGKGTEDQIDFLPADYEIIEKPLNLPEISSSSHPDQNKWYKTNNFYLNWK